jgi:hypothetical protein
MKGDERMRSDAYSQRSTHTRHARLKREARLCAYVPASTRFKLRRKKDVDAGTSPAMTKESGWALADADGNG